ncbi:MAG: hypothetical protein AAGF75_02805, partial [Cyanobacteria bacterium P01_H01_bin.130]
GSLFYPEALDGQLITRDQLTFTELFITDPNGTLIGDFIYAPPFAATDEFRLTYNSATGEILQSDNFDTANGFDLGINFATETGLDFITFTSTDDSGASSTSINLDEITIAGDDVIGLNELDAGGQLLTIPEDTDRDTNFTLADLLDADFYLANNPDVSAAIANGTAPDPLTHYTESGQFEGRDPNAAFDASFYVENNLDIAGILITGQQGIGDHYVSVGHLERRPIAPLFEDRAYLSNNPDVLSAVRSGDIASAGEHYFKFGLAEGRSALTTVDLS